MFATMCKTGPLAAQLSRRLVALAGALAAALALTSQATAQTNGMVISLGGTGTAGYQDGIQGFSEFNNPHGVAAPGNGFIYIADQNNNAIRALRLSDRTVSTYTTANISRPVALVFDSATNLFVANQGNGTITRYDSFGNYRETLRPNLTGGQLTALANDQQGNLYIAQLNGVVTRITPAGAITGTFTAPAGAHEFRGVAVRGDGTVFVSDSVAHVIWKYSGPGAAAEHFAGTLNFPGKTQGERGLGQLNRPHQIAIGPKDTIVIADRGNHQVRAASCEGVVSVLYGIDPARWFTYESPEVFPGWWDSTAEFAELRDPVGVTVDSAGTVYDTEVFYHLVRSGVSMAFPDCGGQSSAPVGAILSPSKGVFTQGQTAVIIISPVEGEFGPETKIYYTLDGSDPTTSDALVPLVDGERRLEIPGPFDLANLRVRVFNNGVPGPVVAGEPTIFEPLSVLLTPNQGYFPEGVDVQVTSAVPGGFGSQVQIFYTLDGTDPTQNSNLAEMNNGAGVIRITGPVDLQTLRVRAFNNGVPGPIASGQQPLLPLPGLNPPSGYFVTNVVITITNASNPSGLFPAGTRLFYSRDGSQPTQSSLEVPITGGVGRLELQGPINLEDLSVRAFLGNTPGATVTGQPTSDIPNRISFGFESPQEASSDFVASAGQRFYAPVTLQPRPGQTMYGLQFAVTVTNLTGPAAPNYFEGFESMLKKPDPENQGAFLDIPAASLFSKTYSVEYVAVGPNVIQVTNVTMVFTNLLVTNSTSHLMSVGWLERHGATNLYNTLEHDLIRYSIAHDTLFLSPSGKVVPGSYSFVVPAAAAIGDTYQIEIIRPSANGDGVRDDVFIEAPKDPAIPVSAIKTVTVGERRYTVGDLAPFRWFNAGDFGDGSILNNDLEQIHQSVIYRINEPPPGSDFEGAMDSCCVDTNGVDRSATFQHSNGDDLVINQIGFGDGRLNVADLFVSFRRALDPSLVWYQRYWSNGTLRAEVVPNTFRGQMTGFSLADYAMPSGTGGKLSAFASTAPALTLRIGAAVGKPGQLVAVPVYGEVAGDQPLRTLLLTLKVRTVDGPVGLSDNLSFEAHPLLGAPTFGGGGTTDSYGGAWLELNHSGLTGQFLLGTLYVQIPANATASSAFVIHVEHASASPNGLSLLPTTTHDGAIIMEGRTNIGWNDGIPDEWRIQYFGTLGDLAANSTLDPDGDGVSTRAEFDLGTNPVNPNDHLKVRAQAIAGQLVKLRFPTAAGHLYQLESSAALGSGEWTVVQTNILGTGGEIELISNSDAPYGYYRIRIQE